MRSTEVAGVFVAFFGRRDIFGSPDFAQFVEFFMLYRSVWVSGAESIKKHGFFGPGRVEFSFLMLMLMQMLMLILKENHYYFSNANASALAR